MVFFISPDITPKAGGSAITANALLRQKLDTLDIEYEDVFNDDIKSAEYFDKKRKVLEDALNNPQITATKKADISNDLLQLQKDKAKWDIENHKIFDTTVKQLSTEIDDLWKSIWKNKDFLRSGDLPLMADTMIYERDGINFIKGMFQEGLNQLKEFTTDDKIITQLEENIEFLDQREIFWRGVMTKPKEFAIEIDSEADGSIKDFRVVDVVNAKGKKLNVKYGNELIPKEQHISMYGTPHPTLTDDEGNEHIKIGSNSFSGLSGDKEFTFEGEGGFDLSTLNNRAFGNYGTGAVLKVSDKNYLVYQEDGSFLNYRNENDLLDDGFSKDNTVNLSNDEFSKIQGMYDIETKEQVQRQENIDLEMNKIIEQYQDKTSAWYQFKNLSAEERINEIGQTIGVLGRSGIGLGEQILKTPERAGKAIGATVEGIGEFVSGITGEDIKESIKRAGSVIEPFRSIVQPLKRIGEAGKIFKGLFGSIKEGFKKGF